MHISFPAHNELNIDMPLFFFFLIRKHEISGYNSFWVNNSQLHAFDTTFLKIIFTKTVLFEYLTVPKYLYDKNKIDNRTFLKKKSVKNITVMENITVVDGQNRTIMTPMELCEMFMINCTGRGIFTVRDLCESGIGKCTDFDPFPVWTTSIRTSNTGLNVALMIIGTLITLLGLIGNSVTIVIVRLRSEFHTTTYTTIGLLALVDLVATCLRVPIVLYSLYYLQWFNSLLSTKSTQGLYIGTFITYVCSCVHVVILARLRYKLLAYPIEGLTISVRNIVYQSLMAWGVSCILGVPYGFSVYNTDIYQARIVEIILGHAICFCTVAPIVVFHVLKIRKLRGGISSMNRTIHSMNKMVLAICAVQIVSTLSVAFFSALSMTDIALHNYHIHLYFGFISQILLLVGHAMNPIFFFYFTSCHRMRLAYRNRHGHRNRHVETPV